jgi:RNA polymerase sigma-70 factor (ECF subfamily)
MEPLTLMKTEVDSVIEVDVALVDTARHDPAAFTLLYRRYMVPVYRYLYKWVGNSAEAEDLTSQVFIDVLEGLVHYQEQGHFAAWLFTIARRKAIAAHRRRRLNLSLDEVEDLPAPTQEPLDHVVRREQRERMAAIFARLNEDQRELLRLRFTAGLRYTDIGAVLGRSEASVKMAVSRILRQMYEKWSEE